MAIQEINLGSAPTGAGGDTFRSTGTKVNENFTNNTHAASRYVGTATGNLMEVGAFGLGIHVSHLDPRYWIGNGFKGFDPGKNGLPLPGQGISVGWEQAITEIVCLADSPQNRMFFRTGNDQLAPWAEVRHTGNTTIDSNGFIKAASPVVQLFPDKISANDEASEQNPVFEKVDIGHYLIKNTEGFSDDGWYIEMPKDANGNVLVAVQYEQLEDNTIEVKTFAKKFDEKTGDIVPNLEKPRDIPTGRWIDIRLKALPQPEIEISNTPADFQPTNLAQAVAEALKNDSEQ